MSDQNVQQLPPGLANRAAAAGAAPPAAPAAVAPPAPPVAPSAYVAPVDRDPAPQAPLTPPPGIAPVTPPPQPQAPAPTVPQPQKPLAPVEVPKPAAPAGDVTVAALAGNLAQDSNLAPAVSYLDAILKENGVDVQRALGQAAGELDARFIDQHYLVEKLGAEKAALVAKVATDTINYANAYTNESLNQVYATAGGQDQFAQAAKVFNEKADATEKAMLAKLLDSGDRAQMLYAANRIAEFGVQAGVVVRHNAQAFGTPGAAQGLSREEYLKAIGERNVSPERYEQLKEQRKLGMAQGR